MLMNVNHDGDAEGHAVHLQLVCALHSAPICDEQNAGDLKLTVAKRYTTTILEITSNKESHVENHLQMLRRLYVTNHKSGANG